MGVDRSANTVAMGAVDAAPLGEGRVVNKLVTVPTSATDIVLPAGTWRYVEWTVLTADARVVIAVNETAALGSGALSDGTTSTWKPGASRTGVVGALTPSTPLVGGADVLNGIASADASVEINLYKDLP